jgi:hypothetical protein
MGEKALLSTDKKVDEILTGLAAGQTREQIALELGYKNFKSLDIYMKRKNFDWDNKKNYYFPKRDRTPIADALKLMNRPEGRVAAVLSLLKSGLDIKEISVQLKFHDHRELALFMKGKGYTWGEKDQTFTFSGKNIISVESNTSVPDNSLNESGIKKGAKPMLMNESSSEVMTFLENNKEALFELISTHASEARIPRYTIRGVYTTKSVSMNYGMDQLIREYSKEKNVSQKDVVEVALIEFFKKYGFQNEVSTLISQ